MRRIITVLSALTLLFFLTAGVQAAEKSAPPKKLSALEWLIDYSPSMGGNLSGFSQAKIDLAAALIEQLNQLIATHYEQAGIHTFSGETEIRPTVKYVKSEFASSVQEIARAYPSYAGSSNSSLGNAFDLYDPAFSDLARPGAVIVVTDGVYSHGRDSLNETKIFHLTQPGLCLHFISFADNPAGQELIDDMAAISPQTVSARAADLLNDSGARENFARRAFYNCPSADLPGIVPGALDSLILSMPFDFDSDKITERTRNVAAAVLRRMQEEPGYSLKIDGYTCIIGPDAYNADLSRRRAESVRNYLINGGINPNRLIIQGYGKNSPRYGNDTREGRSLNRRVEFTFFMPAR
ncbi:MAG: OmpA family protein [Desulfovibrionaceae bacterium]|nr:OmpA family protein [Desulfovibrionaceae bacterium]